MKIMTKILKELRQELNCIVIYLVKDIGSIYKKYRECFQIQTCVGNYWTQFDKDQNGNFNEISDQKFHRDFSKTC